MRLVSATPQCDLILLSLLLIFVFIVLNNVPCSLAHSAYALCATNNFQITPNAAGSALCYISHCVGHCIRRRPVSLSQFARPKTCPKSIEFSESTKCFCFVRLKFAQSRSMDRRCNLYLSNGTLPGERLSSRFSDILSNIRSNINSLNQKCKTAIKKEVLSLSPLVSN